MPVEVESIVLHPQLAASGGVEIIVGLLVTSGWGAGMGYRYGVQVWGKKESQRRGLRYGYACNQSIHQRSFRRSIT